MIRFRAIFSLCLVGAAVALAPASAAAERFVPTRFNDPPPNGCKPDDCSLREAIRAANNKGGPDKIILSRGTYEMRIPGTSGASIDDGDFNVLGDLTIRGQGPGKTVVDGNGLDRVFTAGGTVKFQDLKITGGDASANTSHTSVGGGVAAFGDDVVLKHVVVTENSAEFGGGVESYAEHLTIVRSTFFFNQATEGGGLDLRSSIAQPVTDLKASSFVSNVAHLKGGGILADGYNSPPNNADPFVRVVNSTFVNNVAVTGGGPDTYQGGAIMSDNGAIVALDFSTVVGNRAGDAYSFGVGGGLYQHGGAQLNPGNSIIGGNQVGVTNNPNGASPRSDVDGAQCAGTLSGYGGNLVQTLVGNSCTISGGYDEASYSGLQLGAFDNHGGPTKTFSLLPGSPAIGHSDVCLPTDQRGVDRPNENCDTGAYEDTGP